MTATAQRLPDLAPDDPKSKLTRKQIATRAAVLIGIGFCLFMWIYAFGFANDKPLAQVDDSSWSVRAEQICKVRDDLLNVNAEEAILDSKGTPQDVGAAVKKATDITEDALDEVLAVRPTSARDVRLVNEWESLYRTYIADRREVETRLLGGEAVELNETTLNGSPVSLTIGDFAKHNKMPTCQVPAGR
ncbi:MAG: hypothetical protein ABIR32_10260 [Ilumatobacteraceae bacterium]